MIVNKTHTDSTKKETLNQKTKKKKREKNKTSVSYVSREPNRERFTVEPRPTERLERAEAKRRQR